jgi:hypothetical protein
LWERDIESFTITLQRSTRPFLLARRHSADDVRVCQRDGGLPVQLAIGAENVEQNCMPAAYVGDIFDV